VKVAMHRPEKVEGAEEASDGVEAVAAVAAVVVDAVVVDGAQRRMFGCL
jgi:hypothetical protein